MKVDYEYDNMKARYDEIRKEFFILVLYKLDLADKPIFWNSKPARPRKTPGVIV